MNYRVKMICLLVLVGAVAGCNAAVEGTIDAGLAVAEAPVFVAPVHAALPKRGDISSFFETTSRIEAQNRIEVLSKGTGLSLKVNVEVGDIVTPGQSLVELERDELEAQVRQARVTVQQQRTALEIAERSFNEGIGASVERDNARFAYEQARATLEMSDLKLRNQTVHAPIGGIITQRYIQQGMVVSPGLPLFTIVDPTSYTLPINIPEKELARLSLGQEAQARIDAFPDRAFTVRVSRINPSIDPLSGTVRILLDFEEADKPLLRDAAFARVRLVMEVRPDVQLIPRDAVLEEEGRKYVFLLEKVDESTMNMERFTGVGGRAVYKAHRVEIRTGLEQSDVVEVIEGIPDGKMVVTMGQHTLKQDAYVTITNIEEELALRAAMTVEEALAAAERDKATTVNLEASSVSELELTM